MSNFDDRLRRIALTDGDRAIADRHVNDNARLKFAVRYHRTKDVNTCLDFSGRPWLAQLYSWDPQELVASKCVQVGVTEFMLVAMLEMSGVRGWWVLALYPTDQLRNRVAVRMDRAIELSKEYKKLLTAAAKPKNDVGMKAIGNGYIVLAGSQSEANVVEMPADAYFVDELDVCNQDTVAKGHDRISASKHKYVWKVGNPTVTGYGITQLYQESDQRRWKIACDHCGKHQEMDWFRHVVRQTGEREYELLDREWTQDKSRDVYVLCARCHKPLDRGKAGNWVAAHRNRSLVGVTMSQLMLPTMSVKDLAFNSQYGFFAATHDNYKFSVFVNSRCGQPFDPPGTSLTEDLFARCAKQVARNQEPCQMGVDVGSWLDVTVTQPFFDADGNATCHMVHFGRYRRWEDLDQVIEKFNVNVCVIDMFPEQHKAREFQAKHQGRVWLCKFGPPSAVKSLDLDESTRSITAARTQVLDAYTGEFAAGRLTVPMDFRDLVDKKWLSMMCAIKRMYDPDAKPPRFTWVSTGADHAAFSGVYCWMARQLMLRGAASSPLAAGYDPRSTLEDLAETQYQEDYRWLLGK